MKALWRFNNGAQYFKNIDEPQLQSADDVKIKIMYNTIGIQDLRMDRDWDFYSKSGVAGYEMSGIIVELGENAKAKGFYIGQHVTGTVADFCGQCFYCKKGMEQNCLRPSVHNGTYCEYIVWKYSQLLPLNENLSFSIGCLTEPVAVVYMAFKKLDVKSDSSICIFGADFNGLVLIQLAKLAGVKNITVVEPKQNNQLLAKKFGATSVLSPLDEAYETKLLELSDFMGFEKTVVCSSNPDFIDVAVSVTSRGGIILFTVYFNFDKYLSINSVQFFAMNISLTSSFLYSKEVLNSTLDVMEKLELEDLISEEYFYSDAASAFESETRNRFPRIGIRFFESD